MSRAIQLAAMAVAFIWACVPAAPVAAPETDSSDGGSFCVTACNARIKSNCIEPELVPRCVPTCEKARKAGTYEDCSSCTYYLGSDSQTHVRCTP